MNLRELQTEAHKIAVEHGWWDKENPRSLGELLALIHSEVAETTEEIRCGRPMTQNILDENGKPCGVPAELADIVIRILDLIGSIPDCDTQFGFEDLIDHPRRSLPPKPLEVMEALHKGLAAVRESDFEESLVRVIIAVMDFCEREKIDLEKAVLEKMEYNRTRPYRHGGKKA